MVWKTRGSSPRAAFSNSKFDSLENEQIGQFVSAEVEGVNSNNSITHEVGSGHIKSIIP